MMPPSVRALADAGRICMVYPQGSAGPGSMTRTQPFRGTRGRRTRVAVRTEPAEGPARASTSPASPMPCAASHCRHQSCAGYRLEPRSGSPLCARPPGVNAPARHRRGAAAPRSQNLPARRHPVFGGRRWLRSHTFPPVMARVQAFMGAQGLVAPDFHDVRQRPGSWNTSTSTCGICKSGAGQAGRRCCRT